MSVLSAGIAYASPPTTVTFADDFVFTDMCSGENIHFTGTTTVSVSFTVQNDISHEKIHIVERDDGTGLTTEASYKANAEENLEENVKLINGTGEENAVINANVIGKGAVANESIKETFHVTVSANGTVTVFRTSIEDTCHG